MRNILRSVSILALAGAALSAHAAEFHFSGYLTSAKQSNTYFLDHNDPKNNINVTGKTFWGVATSTGVTIYTSGPAWSSFSTVTLPDPYRHSDPYQGQSYDMYSSLSGAWGGGFVGNYEGTYYQSPILWGGVFLDVATVNVDTNWMTFSQHGYNDGSFFWNYYMTGVVTDRFEVVGPNGPTPAPAPAAALPFALMALRRRKRAQG